MGPNIAFFLTWAPISLFFSNIFLTCHRFIGPFIRAPILPFFFFCLFLFLFVFFCFFFVFWFLFFVFCFLFLFLGAFGRMARGLVWLSLYVMFIAFVSGKDPSLQLEIGKIGRSINIITGDGTQMKQVYHLSPLPLFPHPHPHPHPHPLLPHLPDPKKTKPGGGFHFPSK